MPEDTVRDTTSRMKSSSAKEALNLLRSAVVKTEDFYDTNSRLGRSLEERVEQQARDFVQLAPDAVTLGTNEVIAGFFYGLRKAVATGKVEFSDADVQAILQAAEALKGIHESLPETHRSWVLHAFTDLVREMARQTAPVWITAQRQELLVKLCGTLLPVSDSESGIVEHDYPNLQTEWISHSINSARGYLGHAISQLAANSVYAVRHDSRADFKTAEREALSLQRRLFTEFEDPLLRVGYGGFLPFFWTHRTDFFEELYEYVFPKDDHLWSAVWSGYSDPRTRVVSLYRRLETEYLRSLRLLEALADESDNLGLIEWSHIAVNDVALFWQADQIETTDPVLAKMCVVKHDWILSSIPDVIAVNLEREKDSKKQVVRAVELIKLIQHRRQDLDDSAGGDYWSRLQLLLNKLPARAWADELQDSLRKCLSASGDIYYFDVAQFLRDLKEINPGFAIEILLLMANRTSNHPWLLQWDAVETLVSELRSEADDLSHQSDLDQVERLLNRN